MECSVFVQNCAGCEASRGDAPTKRKDSKPEGDAAGGAAGGAGGGGDMLDLLGDTGGGGGGGGGGGPAKA
eukprot:1083588-Rhodomonas_salina.1